MVVGLAGLDKIAPAKPIRRFLLSYPGFADAPLSNKTRAKNFVSTTTRTTGGCNGASPITPAPISGSGGVKRVELVYWPDLGHGHPLIRPRALNELMETVERQAKAFGLGLSSPDEETRGCS